MKAEDSAKNALFTAIHDNDEEKLIELLKNNKETDLLAQYDENGETPLTLAIKLRHDDIVAKLLENNVDPNLPNQKGEAPLIIALDSENMTSAYLLKESNAELIKNENLPLILKNAAAIRYFEKKAITSAMWDAAMSQNALLILSAPEKEKKRLTQIGAVTRKRRKEIKAAKRLILKAIKSGTLNKELQERMTKDVEELKMALNNIDNQIGLDWQTHYSQLDNVIETMKERLSSYKEFPELQTLNASIQTILDRIEFGDIYHLPFTAQELAMTVDDIEWENINRICFRGDDRDPKEIFSKGFSLREENTSKGFIEGPFVTNKYVIQFTTRFTTAAFFPMESTDNTWVYVFKADKGFNVHKHSIASLVNTKDKTINLDENNVAGMFVQELATDRIPAENIIAAVKIKRSPRKDPYEGPFEGYYEDIGTYEIVGYQLNENSKVSAADKKLAVDFIEKEILANKHEKNIPLPSSGYNVNMGFFSQQKEKDSDGKKEISSESEIDINKKGSLDHKK